MIIHPYTAKDQGQGSFVSRLPPSRPFFEGPPAVLGPLSSSRSRAGHRGRDLRLDKRRKMSTQRATRLPARLGRPIERRRGSSRRRRWLGFSSPVLFCPRSRFTVVSSSTAPVGHAPEKRKISVQGVLVHKRIEKQGRQTRYDTTHTTSADHQGLIDCWPLS